jgi:glycosyltransferase involved in cell wall biosynthesis
MTSCLATIIIPTTGDRGSLLIHSIKSVQNQTINDIEIFIVGDGVEGKTKNIIYDLISADSRISFFDYPKHERRGEIYRHEVIQKANGRSIFYLCDRDLMLPNHVVSLLEILKRYNFVSSTFINVKRDQTLTIDQYVNYFGSGKNLTPSQRMTGSLSCIAHTKKMYFALDYGWRTTPLDKYTDAYMWRQFLSHEKCLPFSSPMPTVLYFKRGDYPGDPIDVRAKELSSWSSRLSKPKGIPEIMWQAMAGLLIERRKLRVFYSATKKITSNSKSSH